MTGLLEQALRRVEALKPEEQDALAAQIIETLDDEEAWARRFQDGSPVLQALAREAMEEHRRGETRPLDELIGSGLSLRSGFVECTRASRRMSDFVR